MLLSMEPSGRLLLSPSRGAASRKTDAATRNCGGDPVGYMVRVQEIYCRKGWMRMKMKMRRRRKENDFPGRGERV